MYVELRPDRNDPIRTVAFIDGCIAFFPKDKPTPKAATVDVMITGIMYCKDGNGAPIWNKPKFFFIREVTPDDILVEHAGFERSGSICTTTASSKYNGKFLLLTPGRTGVHFVDNVNANYTGYKKLVPSSAYVRKQDIEAKTTVRIEGLDDYSDMLYYNTLHEMIEETNHE